MPSTRTEPVACRVEPLYVDALRLQAEINGQTLSAALADMIRRSAMPQVVTRASSAPTGV